MKLSYTSEEIERWRDRVHRRKPARAVSTKDQAVTFVNEVGFCYAFKVENSDLPCLWHAASGQRAAASKNNSQSDPFLSFVWKMKRVLPAEGKVFYGRVFKRRPTIISMEFFPDFYALSLRTGRRDDYVQEFKRQQLSHPAKEIMDALRSSAPQVTRGLKIATGYTPGTDSREFDRAMTELQTKFYIVKVAEHFDPFTFEWNTVDRAYSREVRRAQKIRPEDARKRILQKYFENQLVGTIKSIQTLFGWKKQIIFETMGQLMAEGRISGGVTVDGDDSRYYCLVTV